MCAFKPLRTGAPALARPRVALLLLVGLLGIGSGCSAVTSRTLVGLSSDPAPPLYFGGVRTDYELIAAAPDGGPLFWPVYGVIDLPFSFCGDLLLSPYDFYTDCRFPNGAKPEAQ